MTKVISRTIDLSLARLPSGLRAHIYRVEELSVMLAQAHGVDEGKARLGSRAHDLCRAMTSADLLSKARDMAIPIHPIEESIPSLLHGPVAAETLRRQGLQDAGIYSSIYYHTTASTGLEPLAKVVFLADKLDPTKIERYPYLTELRTIALASLDEAILKFLTIELESQLKRGNLIHPVSVEARNELLQRMRIY